jgi:MFS family permease
VPAIARPLLMMAIVGTFTFTFEFEVSLPLLARTTFHGSSTTYSWLLAGLGAGASTIQLASEPDYRGRVTALWSMALVGSTPIGSPIIGALSDLAGPRYALGLGAAACLAAAAVG